MPIFLLIMDKNVKKDNIDYVSPMIGVVLVEVERGYAESSENGGSGMNTPGWGGL